jgi:predicted lipoprotein with Yx(FWY)xxD motif
MAPTRRQFIGAATASSVVGLAGCGSDSGGSGGSGTGGDTGSGGDTPIETPTPVPAGVAVELSDHPDLGEILVDGDGMTLYMFDSDTQGDLASTCTDGCADAWPPLPTDGEPAAGDDVAADLETFERDDGSTQVAANGWPLYYFQNDESAGDATGQGVNDVWWVLDPSGTPIRSSAPTPTGTTDDGPSY